MKRRISSIVILIVILFPLVNTTPIYSEEGDSSGKLEINAKSAVLMEASTGKVIYENNPHERLRPASVTKIMTLLLIYEAVESGKISWDDEVVVSEHASSMGGSQVYLEPNEIQTVATMTKCVAVASANDAAVAMAEHISGSENGFVELMNQRAKELGMNDTNFVNASGLDHDEHLTSAYDIALMSRELINQFPEITELTTIWQDTITHKTRRGEEEFGLTNTNKLIKWYEGTTGLKTGSTSKALYCLSGTAKRNGLHLIGVVMAAPDYKTRFREVMKMLDYGFANCKVYEDKIASQKMTSLPVKKGVLPSVDLIAKDDFSSILDPGVNDQEIKKEFVLEEYVNAPIIEGDKLGEIVYKVGNKELGRIDLIANQNIKEATLNHYIKYIFKKFFG